MNDKFVGTFIAKDTKEVAVMQDVVLNFGYAVTVIPIETGYRMEFFVGERA